MKRIGVIGTILIVLSSLIGILQFQPVDGQYNIFLSGVEDPEEWATSKGYEFVRYNEQIQVLTVIGKLTPLFVSLQSDVTKLVTDVEMTIQDAPDDPDWGRLWGMQRITASGASYDITEGTSRVVAAVIDTGVDTRHPDLRAICKRSTIGGACVDGHGHGTHVAGTIAAIVDNGTGVAGVVSSDIVRVWGYKVLSDNGSGTSSSVAQGVTLATNDIVAAGYRGVINMSLGADTGGRPDPTIDAAVNYATRYGVVVISAAGNSNLDYCAAPAISVNSMCVGAIAENGSKAGFSNYGRGLDIVAPGVNIRSTLPGARYVNWNGTSMATPHVTGSAVALLSVHPDWTVDRIRRELLDGADPPAVPDPKNYYGSGVVNVYRSLSRSNPGPTPNPPTVEPTAEPTALPTPIATEPAERFYDYSDSDSPWPVISLDRTGEEGIYLGRTVTSEDTAYTNEEDDGAVYFDTSDRKWQEIEGKTLPKVGRRAIYTLIHSDSAVWIRGCLARPDGSLREEFFFENWTSGWYRGNYELDQKGHYVLRIMVGRETPTTCGESGVGGEVSDYFFIVRGRIPTPAPTVEPTAEPTPDEFWIRCIRGDVGWNCQTEGR